MSDKVSVICISYNHAPFVKKALQSVFNQSYVDIEVIILDDGSKDDSVQMIREATADQEVKTVFHSTNQGYTKTFNEGFALSTGKYIVDFALDDMMKPDFVMKSVEKLQFSSANTGVVFSNADYIDEQGGFIGNHNEELFKKSMIKEVPSGDIFKWILKRYFICTPTMLIKREVFDRLGGYDESLAYEDFDFWVRSSRYWHYTYLDEVLMQKRKLRDSMSNQRYRYHLNEQMNSVYKVCEKAFHLCKTKGEKHALLERLNYEYRQCLRTDNVLLAQAYKELIFAVGGRISPFSYLAKMLNREKVSFML